MEYYSAIIRNTFESVLMRWMNLEPIVQSEVSQKERDEYRAAAASAAKSLQLYPTLCDPRDSYTESRKMVLKNLFIGQQ